MVTNVEQAYREAGYWILREVAEAAASEAMRLSLRPERVLAALTDGFEDALEKHKAKLEQAASGH